MKFVHGSNVNEWLHGRGPESSDSLKRTVEGIISDVEKRGDEAVLEAARKFDAPSLTQIEVTKAELESATVDNHLFESIRFALKRVQYFHLNQLEVILSGWYDSQLSLIPDILELKLPRRPIDARWAISREPSRVAGVYPRAREFGIGQRLVSLDRVGVYVPGGRANYPSSVLMNAGPATVAQVPHITVCSPAREDGTLHPSVLVALRETGVDKTLKVGGATAIAALALGTETIQRVDKVVGPGNQYVNEAKRQLWGRCGFDGYAGPSEVAVLISDQSNYHLAALDILTQIEHAPNNVAFLVSWNESALHETHALCLELCEKAHNPVGIKEALAGSYAVLVKDENEAVDVLNAIAPEHLSVGVQSPDRLLNKIQNAGCVLLGDMTPESAGDYVLGPSHTLPTGGAARWQSPVNVMDFLKFQSVSQINQDEIKELAAHIDTLARAEGFSIHALDATERANPLDHLSEVKGC